ncbi:MAG: permease-like cell division protein FtsX [Desulfobacterales bacterium]|jgi:cell division transport system permease protein|nr:permease-like cell division protein FtsX [Desulfobacterales bacterium]
MNLLLSRALQDIIRNRWLNTIAVVTIALSVLIVSAFGLFFINAEEVIRSWEKGVRMMVYLKPGTEEQIRKDIEEKLLQLDGVSEVLFISKQEALDSLKVQMQRQKSLLEGLRENPLPEAFEIRLATVTQNERNIETLATRIETFSAVDEVEYGQQWMEKAIYFFQLFRLAGFAMGTLFFMAAVSIVANTIRLLLYSRQTEIEIMRIVGATDRFIKSPFYIEGMLQGIMGAAIGLSLLALVYFLASSNMQQGLSTFFFHIRFFSVVTLLEILACSMLVGWIGCYLSLKQFLK